MDLLFNDYLLFFFRSEGNLFLIQGGAKSACRKGPVHRAKLMPRPHADMPHNVLEDYEEAMGVFQYSSKSAAALLRLALQKLCGELGEKGKRIDDDIKSLVNKGLPVHIQQALDIVRVMGNEAVHPGTIDISDNPEIAMQLFGLLNEVVEDQISKKKNIQQIYESLPQNKLDAIAERDKRNNSLDI